MSDNTKSAEISQKMRTDICTDGQLDSENYMTKRTYNCTYIYMSYADGYNLQTGVDALEFVQGIPDHIFAQVDCVIWDPPYMDPSDPTHVERLNHRTGLRYGHTYTRFLSRERRKEILSIIKKRMNPDGHIIQFHTLQSELFTENVAYRLIWVKSEWSGISGSPVINNGEYINIIGPKQAQASGQFYTPFDLALLTVNIIDLESPEDTVHDPAVGGGVFLLAARYHIHKQYGWKVASKFGAKLSGQDLSHTAWLMASIQLRLTNYTYLIELCVAWFLKLGGVWQQKIGLLLKEYDWEVSDE